MVSSAFKTATIFLVLLFMLSTNYFVGYKIHSSSAAGNERQAGSASEFRTPASISRPIGSSDHSAPRIKKQKLLVAIVSFDLQQ
jgi:hypothetical protein